MQCPEYWLLIDGLNLAYRSFHAMPELTRADGFPTQAIHGWIRTVWRLLDTQKPDHVVVFFDIGGSDERLAILPEYKAQRPDMPEGLRAQLPELKRLCAYAGHAVVEEQGVEADDLLGAAAIKLAQEGKRVAIVSADKDFAQLLDHPGVVQLVPPPTANPKIGWQMLDGPGVEAKFGVRADQIVDYLALIGDTSDNIPGIPGVGPKTAVNWLKAWGNMEGVLAHVEELKPERFRERVKGLAMDLKRNQGLVRLNIELQVKELYAQAVDVPALIQFFKTMEMRATQAMVEKRYGVVSEKSVSMENRQQELF